MSVIKNKNISDNVTYSEGIKSQTAVRLGIKNDPNPEQLANMQHVANNVFEKVRKHFGIPLTVSSFFRSKALNDATKGASATSQHMTGEAMDIDADGSSITNKQVFDFIKNNLDFDQLIWEFGNATNPAWVHVSLKRVGKNRKQVLTIK
jgi:zinc D-Ala-D-Ala carboxypeptidase